MERLRFRPRPVVNPDLDLVLDCVLEREALAVLCWGSGGSLVRLRELRRWVESRSTFFSVTRATLPVAGGDLFFALCTFWTP